MFLLAKANQSANQSKIIDVTIFFIVVGAPKFVIPDPVNNARS